MNGHPIERVIKGIKILNQKKVTGTKTRHGRVIKGTKVLAEIKNSNPGTKTKYGKQIYTTKNIKNYNNTYKVTNANEQLELH